MQEQSALSCLEICAARLSIRDREDQPEQDPETHMITTDADLNSDEPKGVGISSSSAMETMDLTHNESTMRRNVEFESGRRNVTRGSIDRNFSSYRNCSYSGGRGCPFGPIPHRDRDILRYTIRSPQRGRGRLGRARSGRHWTDTHAAGR